MSTGLATFLFEAVNFLLLAGLLGYLLFRPVRRALDSERERHARRSDELAAQERELDARREALDRDERAAQQRRDQADAQAAEAIAEERAAARREARRAAEAERSRLESEFAARRRAEVLRVADDVGRLSGDAVAALLQALDGPSLDAALVRGAVEQLQALQVRTATVEAARPLTAEAAEAIGRCVDSCDVRLVPELGAGVRITSSAGQIDATALSVSREAAQQAAAAMRVGPPPTDDDPDDPPDPADG